MPNLVVLGLQWGDEGKGKIVDLLCPAFPAVARYQGGNNAGHTVKFGDRHHALHLIPSGILHADTRCVLGNGMVIDPAALFAELDELAEAGVETAGRLFVSDRAQVILPLHVAVDRAREAAAGEGRIGTTARGIGPCYEAKSSRFGLRVGDLGASDLDRRLERLVDHFAPELEALGAEVSDAGELAAACREHAERLAPYVVDTHVLLHGWMAAGDGVLLEGAQGALLDLDHGTYPFVTSSSPTAGGATIGAGIPPRAIDGVLGVLKAYTSRVGEGPFVGELHDDTGEFLRERGNEFGTTTGRPRRCGWLDLVASRYATRLNGVDAIALTKLDVLDTLAEIPVCVGYRIDGEVRSDFPASVAALERAEPIYEELPGWQRETVGVLDLGDLPAAARDYIAFVEEHLEVPVAIVSTGPRREETALRPGEPLARLTGGALGEVEAARDG